MTQQITEPWQEFDPGPEPGDRGVTQDGKVCIWHAARGWQPEPQYVTEISVPEPADNDGWRIHNQMREPEPEA